MNIIIGALLASAGLLVGLLQPGSDQDPSGSQQTGANVVRHGARDDAPVERVGTPAASSRTPEAVSAGKEQTRPASAVESATEQDVLVFRHGSGTGSSAPSAGVAPNVGEQAALAELGAALARVTEAPAGPRPYPLAIYHIIDPWKYSRPRELNPVQRELLWQYKPQGNWTYHPVPTRSAAEVERLTRYRPMLP